METATAAVAEKINTQQEQLRDYYREIGFEGSTAEDRLRFIEAATPEGILAVADKVHRIVAPEANTDHHPEQMKLVNPQGEVTHRLAMPEERMQIITHAVENAKAVVAKYRAEGGSIDNALERSGNSVVFGLGLAHFWDNGNGRMLRSMGHVIRYGTDPGDTEKNRDLDVASAPRPETGFKITSYVPKIEGANENPMAFLDQVVALDVPLDTRAYAEATNPKFTVPYPAGNTYPS